MLDGSLADSTKVVVTRSVDPSVFFATLTEAIRFLYKGALDYSVLPPFLLVSTLQAAITLRIPALFDHIFTMNREKLDRVLLRVRHNKTGNEDGSNKLANAIDSLKETINPKLGKATQHKGIAEYDLQNLMDYLQKATATNLDVPKRKRDNEDEEELGQDVSASRRRRTDHCQAYTPAQTQANAHTTSVAIDLEKFAPERLIVKLPFSAPDVDSVVSRAKTARAAIECQVNIEIPEADEEIADSDDQAIHSEHLKRTTLNTPAEKTSDKDAVAASLGSTSPRHMVERPISPQVVGQGNTMVANMPSEARPFSRSAYFRPDIIRAGRRRP